MTPEPPLPDDIWERFVQDTERSIRETAPKEPSARARMVTERLRLEDEKRQKEAGSHKWRKRAAPPQPDGWRTGPAWQEMNGRATRKRRVLGGIAVVAAAAVTVFIVNPGMVVSWLPGGSHKKAAEPLPAETARPTGAPGAASGAPTLSRPFAGSPAEQYADGAAGIVVPEAASVGTLSKEQVASALTATKDFLVAANLDPATIRGGRPDAAIALVDPQQSDVLGEMNTALGKPDRNHDPLQFFSRFDPNEVKMAGDVVKTRGRMTFKEGRDGSVAVHADYTFVYPLTKKADGSREVERTIVRRVVDTEVLDPARFQVTPGKLTLTSSNMNIANSKCGVHDGFLHPLFGSEDRQQTDATGSPSDPYDRSRELESGGDDRCGTATRT
ncbi:hypothetical protein [Streptomyces morookaense]|uniref:Uncharacterized protein n=1 Tax=Streptomyces morookaense TaxID=1970 RepID=A0A7Y7E7F3_STRMO|nr:hypothetical protein [Streptomyces morookaense]NVK78182.1 hypothetical protein [Streptomyces morookaense]GHF31532.1 hypothetical protein GCM10010359_37390 [Streptomyces morookaense]